MNKSLLSLAACALLSLNAYAVDKDTCATQGDDFIYAGGECIQFHEAQGERENILNIIVHGTWPEGSNTLGRYAPFADDLSMQTDITTIAVALPGYSKSSTNNFKALAHKGVKNLSKDKKYIEFLSQLVQGLKEKYEVKTVNYIGHSAGATMGATLTGYNPGLISLMASAGASYSVDDKKNTSNSIALSDFIDDKNITTKYLLIYGTQDKISKPEVTTRFYEKAKAKGMDVTLVKAQDAVHLDLDMSDASVESIVDTLEEE
ncbi:MAG: alpha/beta hydrolase [Campylobacterota bacterium]|nr:alpha/beta hydrolase [Campylobacterota bacterium]